ncbi:MAG: TatD family hydrolase [Firmicutes bacterium]|nr:TatD family hydrolase [Bacillota bacterium]
MLFDSHAHYTDKQFDADRDELLAKMRENNIGKIMNSCSNLEEIPDILKLCEKYDFIYASAGVHPHDVEGMTEADIGRLAEYAKHPKVKAIGEIGLDYYYDNSPRDEQKKWFARQIELARELDMPIVIHDRDAHGDCMDILRSFHDNIKGEFHCFSGSVEMAREALNMGMYIAFGGSLTFKNSVKPKEAAKYVPLDRVLLETDCPYLAPVPMRGERNSSRYLHYTAEMLARIKDVPVDAVENASYENAVNLFEI